MAIPATPTNFYAAQGNRVVQLNWDLATGATSYDIQRSTDGITFSSLATATTNSYQDDTVDVGTQYWYQVGSVNGSGTSTYTDPLTVVPAPAAELSLMELRLRAQERADRVASDFVTTAEWNFFINQAMYELYDLLITCYDDYFEAPEIVFNTSNNQYLYPLPDGVLEFTNSVTGATIVAPPFYKLMGVDLGINNANNAYVTVKRYNLIDRNKFVYPNTASTIYGVFNLQYRIIGNNIRFIPTPSSGQPIRLLYVPRLPQLLAETDITTLGFSGWLQYVIVRAAKYALDKEESDTSKLDAELLFMKQRIEETAVNRDQGQADTISDSRNDYWGGNWGGFRGGW